MDRCPDCNSRDTIKYDKVDDECYCKACGWSDAD